MPYPLSTDYEELFNRISEGDKVAAFVDYKFDREDAHTFRDVCEVRRDGPYRITIGVRGMSYGSIYPFNEEGGPEKEMFIRHCASMNLGWVKPGA